ncbi:MAG: hypothetical protein V3V96_15315 [Acidiferrobacterales bacterium]
MCSFAAAGLALSAVSTGMSFFGQKKEASASRAAGEAQNRIMQMNAIVAEQQAVFEQEAGELRVAEIARKGKSIAGEQRATLAANGVVVDQGTAAVLVDDTFDRARQLTETERVNTAQRVAAQKARAQNFLAQGALAQQTGEAQGEALDIGAFSSLTGGLGSVASKWYDFGNTGGSLGGALSLQDRVSLSILQNPGVF